MKWLQKTTTNVPIKHLEQLGFEPVTFQVKDTNATAVRYLLLIAGVSV
jgi:hypothetical protein